MIPITGFWYVWTQYAVNVPKWDDHPLKYFLLQLQNETSFGNKLFLFFRQHNEHRIAYDRLLTWLDYALWGKLSYTRLMFLGNLSLVGLLAVIGAVLRRSVNSKLHWVLFTAPVAFLLFNLSQWENMFWGMAAVQNFSVVLWVFLSIYLLTISERYTAATVLAILATLTSGNGLLIWPIGIVLLILQRRNKWLTSWALCAAVSIGLYFWGYEKPEGNPPVRGSIVDLVKGWFAFNGAAAEAFAQRATLTWCIILGGLLVISLLGAGIWRLITLAKASDSQQQTPSVKVDFFLLGCLAFILGTGAIVAWSRTGFGIELLITSRYKIYSLTLLVLAYTAKVNHTSGRNQLAAGGVYLVISGLLAWFSYTSFLDETIWWRQWMLTNQFNWTYTTNRPIAAVDPTTARWIDNAPAFYDRILPELYKPSVDVNQPLMIEQTKDSFIITDQTTPNSFGRDAGNYLLLRSAKRIYLFQTTPNLLHSLKVQLGLRKPFTNGFSTQVAEGWLTPDTYQLERLVINPDGTFERHPTGQLLVARPQANQEIKKNW